MHVAICSIAPWMLSVAEIGSFYKHRSTSQGCWKSFLATNHFQPTKTWIGEEFGCPTATFEAKKNPVVVATCLWLRLACASCSHLPGHPPPFHIVKTHRATEIAEVMFSHEVLSSWVHPINIFTGIREVVPQLHSCLFMLFRVLCLLVLTHIHVLL